MCGNLKIEFAGLVLACLTATKTSYGDYFDDVRDMMLTWYKLNILKSKDKDLLDLSLSTLMHSTQYRKAKDPRDKIYSLLGLARGAAIFDLSFSYILPVKEVFTQYTAAMIKDDKNLNVLSDTERDGRNANLPSWVPDWISDKFTHSLAPPRSIGIGIYNINQGIPKDFSFEESLDPRKLSLEGARIDHVTKIICLETLLDKLKPKRFGLFHERQVQLREISRLVESTGFKCSGSCTREMVEIAMLRTLCADRSALSSSMSDKDKANDFGWHNEARLKQRCFPRRNSDLRQPSDCVVRPRGDYGDNNSIDKQEELCLPREWVAADEDIRLLYLFLFEDERAGRQKYQLLRRRKSDSQLLVEISPVGEPERSRVRVVQEACKNIQMQCRGRTLFVTSTGLIGLGPKDARPNDGVYSLIGGEVPFLLRRTAILKEFQLIGEAYVHGIMNGELSNSAYGHDLAFERVVLV